MVQMRFYIFVLIGLLVLTLPWTACRQQEPSVTPVFEQTARESFVQTQAMPLQEVLLPVLNISCTSIFPGDYITFYLENTSQDDEIELVTDLGEQPVQLYDYAGGKLALLPIHYNTPPGEYSLTMDVFRSGQPVLKVHEKITLNPKSFSVQYLKATASQTAMRDPQRWEEDAAEIAAAKSASTALPLWTKDFLLPVEGRITTEFGLTRYINKVLSGRHSGLDIAAPRRTPVRAANDGIVNLSKPLFVTGNTIIIDHGLNLYSIYYHLDELLVEKGDEVKKGQLIGLVGSTGFSTGPHLHWAASIGPVFINPWLLLQENPLNLINNS